MSVISRARSAGRADRDHVLAVLDLDPVESVAVGSWLAREGVDRGLRSGRIWLHRDSLCYSGANLLPVNLDETSARAFAERAMLEGRRCSSIVGRLPATAELWRALEPRWGPARAVRHRQLVMTSDAGPAIAHDPRVRRAVATDLDEFYDASVRMYVEEIGSSPIAHDGGVAYRHRVLQLIRERMAYVVTDGGQIVFKAELGAVTARCAQLQGVWVHPDLRGKGIGTAATAGVVRLARDAGVRTVSLAVNDFNTAAVRAYHRCGFRVTGAQMVVLF